MLQVFGPEHGDFRAIRLVYAKSIRRVAVHEGTTEMKALGEGRSRLAGRRVDEAEVGGAALVGVVVVADVLEAVKAILENHRRCLHHVAVKRAEFSDAGPCRGLELQPVIQPSVGQLPGLFGERVSSLMIKKADAILCFQQNGPARGGLWYNIVCISERNANGAIRNRRSHAPPKDRWICPGPGNRL